MWRKVTLWQSVGLNFLLFLLNAKNLILNTQDPKSPKDFF